MKPGASARPRPSTVSFALPAPAPTAAMRPSWTATSARWTGTAERRKLWNESPTLSATVVVENLARRFGDHVAVAGLDPAPFQAALARAEADVGVAAARLDQARRESGRLRTLVADKFVSQKLADDAASSEAIGEAELSRDNVGAFTTLGMWPVKPDFVGNEVLNVGTLLQYARDFQQDERCRPAMRSCKISGNRSNDF